MTAVRIVAGTLADYARHRKEAGLRGSAKSLISRMKKAGHFDAAIREDGLIDFERADALWEARVRTTPLIEPANGIGALIAGDQFAQARLRREQANAELAEIELAKANGCLLDFNEARRLFGEIGRTYGAVRDNIPAQLAGRLVGITRVEEIERLIREHIRAEDLKLADKIAARFGRLVEHQETGATGELAANG